MMRYFRLLFQLMVYSNIFIALIAMLMYMDISQAISGYWEREWASFIFHGTLFVYSFHWFLNWNSTGITERTRWNADHKWLVLIAGLLGATGMLKEIFSNPDIIILLLPTAMLILLYELRMINKGKVIRYKLRGKTIILTITWTYVTSVMPFIQKGNLWNNAAISSIGLQTCVIYISALLFDKRDATNEKQFHLFYNNIKHFRVSVMLVNFIAFGIALISVLTHTADIFIIGKLSILMIFNLLISYSTKSNADLWYYFVLDGLMGLPLGLIYEIIIKRISGIHP